MEIEIPIWLYELLLAEAAETGSAAGAPLAVEEIAESALGQENGQYENAGIPSVGRTVSEDQGLSAAQQYDAEIVCDRADRK